MITTSLALLMRRYALLDQFGGTLWAMTPSDLKRFPSALVIGNKKLLDLIQEISLHLVDVCKILMAIGMISNPDQTIIDCLFTIFNLRRFNYADNADIEQTTDMGWLIHKYHHIERITVVATRRWNKSKVIGKGQAFG